MCRKDLDLKVREYGAAYGMGIYSDHELLSLVLGISPERLVGGIQEILDFPAKIPGIGKRKELAVFAVKELVRRLMRRESRGIEVIHGPEDAAHFAMPYFKQEQKEPLPFLC